MYTELFFRNQGVLSTDEQEKLRTSSIAIIGLGGTGGFALENLLRTGIENFILFDGDRFELSNMNRQMLCSIPVLDQQKSEIAEKHAKNINPSAKIETNEHFTYDSISKITKADLVIDCTDRASIHVAINQACNINGKVHIYSSCNYSQGMVSVLENYDISKMFQLPSEEEKLKSYEQCTSILAPAASLAGSLASAQAIAYLIDRPYVRAPNVLMFDLFSEKLFWKTRLE